MLPELNELGQCRCSEHHHATITHLLPLCLPSQCVYGGVLRGTGKQAFGATVNAAVYYLIGLPLAAVLIFVVRMRIMGMCCGQTLEAWVVIRHPPHCRFSPTGLWLGMLASTLLVTLAFTAYTARINWELAAEQVSLSHLAKGAGRPEMP